MYKLNFNIWCEKATRLIRFWPDRRKVADELFAHLEDSRDALMAQGMDEKEAYAKAVEAMGSADDIAPQLAALHKPFWGYFLRASQILLVIIVVISLIPIWNYFTKICHFGYPTSYLPFAVFSTASYGEDTGRTLHHLSTPNVTVTADGYRFTVTDAAVYSAYSESTGTEITHLCLFLNQRSLLPWTETEGYYNTVAFTSACREFTARDSLGNFYYSNTTAYQEDPVVGVWTTQTGVFSATHQFRINNFPKEAEWVELCYERDGRRLYLHIDLTGGADK